MAENDGSTNDGTNNNDGSAGSGNADGNVDATKGSTGDGSSSSQGGDNDAPVFTKGDDGKEYIPREAFEGRLKSLTEQRNSARAEAYQTIMSEMQRNPEYRKKVLDSLNIGEDSRTSSKGADEVSPFSKFLDTLPDDKYRGHYQALYEAMGIPQFMEKVSAFEKTMGEVRTWIGETSSENFFKENKAAGPYRKAILQLIEEGRVKSLQDAYDLASLPDRLKGAGAQGVKDEENRKQKAASTSVGNKDTKSVGVSGKPMDRRAAILKALEEQGYQ